MALKYWVFLLFFCISCTTSYVSYDRYGADEFVLDSYKIKEGKFAILEMAGCCFNESENDAENEGTSGTVHIIGAAKKTEFPVNGVTTLFDLIAGVHISESANLFKSYILREGKILSVDLHKLIKEGDFSHNILMRGDDRIFIAGEKDACVMVMGEVQQQKTIAIPNGYIPLQQAIADAGGIRFTGNKAYIQVIRGGLCTPKIYTLRWDHIIHLPSESLLLMDQDIVYIAPKPITEWHRFISQLIPSICGV